MVLVAGELGLHPAKSQTVPFIHHEGASFRVTVLTCQSLVGRK